MRIQRRQEKFISVYVYRHKTATAVVGVGKASHYPHRWATVYHLDAKNQRDGEADMRELLTFLKAAFLGRYDFMYGTAETVRVKGLLYRLKIQERRAGDLTV